MVISKATTVDDYLKELPSERLAVISAMRNFILQNLPAGYEETINWGMISYEIPQSSRIKTYNNKPLLYIGLAAQKNYNSLYLMSIYQNSKQLDFLLQAYQEANLKADMGKSCLHFRQIEDLPLEAIGKIIASTPPDAFIQTYQDLKNH